MDQKLNRLFHMALPESPHYGDQMELYTQFKTKKMTFDKDEIYSNATKIYHPK